MSGVELLQGVYAAFGRGEVPVVLGAMDPAVEWREAESNPYQPSGEPWIGPEAVLEKLFTRLATEWEAFAVHPVSYHDAGEVVVVEGRYTGTCKATGRALDAQLCHVWTLRGGKLVGFQQYTDTAQLRRVMDADD